MMNGDLVRKNIREDLANASSPDRHPLPPTTAKAVDAAYLATLTRRPTPEEAAHFRSPTRRHQGRRPQADG